MTVTTLKFNSNLAFIPYDVDALRGSLAAMVKLQTTINALFSTEEAQPAIRASVESAMTAVRKHSSKLPLTCQALKVLLAGGLEELQSALYGAYEEEEEEDRAEYLQLLDHNYRDCLEQARSKAEDLITWLAPAQGSVLPADFAQALAAASHAVKADTALAQHQAERERVGEQLQAVEQSIAKMKAEQLEHLPASPAIEGATEASAPLIALEVLGKLIDPLQKLFALSDLRKAAGMLREQLEALDKQEALLLSRSRTLVNQLDALEAAAQFEQYRLAYVREACTLAQGVEHFVLAGENPGDDWAVRIGDFSKNTKSLNAYLAPIFSL